MKKLYLPDGPGISSKSWLLAWGILSRFGGWRRKRNKIVA